MMKNIPNVTITKPMGGRACDLCFHKPMFVEEDTYWQHMEEVHAVYHMTSQDLAKGKLADVLKNIADMHPSPNKTKKVLVVGSDPVSPLQEFLKKMGFKDK
jgi:hypothetical protein